MSTAAKKGMTEQQKKGLLIAVFAVLVVGVVVYDFSDSIFGTKPAPPPPPVIINKTAPKAKMNGGGVVATPGVVADKREAQKVGTGSQALDPTLHMEAMLVTESVRYSGIGRNIFATGPTAYETAVVAKKPIKIPDVVQTVRTPVPGPFVRPGPPPINLKFFGIVMRGKGDRRAFLLRGDDVFLASAGDIVDRRYKVISIAANSIVIEDLPNNNKQTLPLLAN